MQTLQNGDGIEPVRRSGRGHSPRRSNRAVDGWLGDSPISLDQCPWRSSVDECGKRPLCSANPGLAMREEKMVELERQQSAIGIAQCALRRLGIVSDQL